MISIIRDNKNQNNKNNQNSTNNNENTFNNKKKENYNDDDNNIMKKLIIIMISLALIMHDFDKNDVDHNTLIITVIFKIIFFSLGEEVSMYIGTC